ncbi:hypothetical protein BDZ89DRAFT_891143, partial [Hymenopellis radicata]
GFNTVFASWILEDNLPFTLGESNGLDRVRRYLKLSVNLPSDTTVRNRLDKIHGNLSDKAVDSKIAAAYDGWTTRQMTFSFGGGILNWISKEWKLIERVIDFHAILEKEHRGV